MAVIVIDRLLSRRCIELPGSIGRQQEVRIGDRVFVSHERQNCSRGEERNMRWRDVRCRCGQDAKSLATQRSRANRIALVTAASLSGGNVAIKPPSFPFDTVCRWSQLIADSRGRPSSGERRTSEGIFRTVLVIGATVTSPRYSRTESRVRTRTGRRLSGCGNLYQRMSPRLTSRPSPVRSPRRRTHQQPLDVAHSLGDVAVPSQRCGSEQSPPGGHRG